MTFKLIKTNHLEPEEPPTSELIPKNPGAIPRLTIWTRMVEILQAFIKSTVRKSTTTHDENVEQKQIK